MKTIVSLLESEGLVKLSQVRVTYEYWESLRENGRDVPAVQRGISVPVVHAPDHVMTEEDLKQYESLRNPARVKDDLEKGVRLLPRKRELPDSFC